MSTDFETLASGAIQYSPWRHDRDKYDIGIKGTGVAATDTAAFSSAVAQLNSWGAGTLWIEGVCKLNSSFDFTGDVSLRGVGTDATIESVDQSTPLTWNSAVTYTTGGTYNISSTTAYAPYFEPSGLTPSNGDWLLLYSSDVLDVCRHSATGNQYPMELVRCYHWDSTNSRAYVDDFVVDAMTTAPYASPKTMLRNVTIENLHFQTSSGFSPADYSRFMQFRAVENLRVINCTFDRINTGAFYAWCCANGIVSGCTFDGLANGEGAYGIAFAVCNGLLIDNCHFSGYRHAVTVYSGLTSGENRWGIARNLVVQNCQVNCPVMFDGATSFTSNPAGIDSHPESWGMVIRGNEISVQGHVGNTGIATNARKTIIDDNYIHGGLDTSGNAAGKGIQFFGGECEITNNTFSQLYTAIDGQQLHYETRADNAKIVNNQFHDIRSAPIVLRGGDNARVMGLNRFDNCGTVTGTTPQRTKAHIQFGEMRNFACSFASAGTTLTVTGNTLWTHDAGDTDKYQGMHLVFTGASLPGNITAGTIYYVKDTISDTTCTISATVGGAAITFDAPGGSGTCYGPHPAMSGHIVANNISIKDNNDHFVETNDADEADVKVYGNTVVGYAGAAFSDRFGFDDELQAEYASLNTGM